MARRYIYITLYIYIHFLYTIIGTLPVTWESVLLCREPDTRSWSLFNWICLRNLSSEEDRRSLTTVQSFETKQTTVTKTIGQFYRFSPIFKNQFIKLYYKINTSSGIKKYIYKYIYIYISIVYIHYRSIGQWQYCSM